MIEQQDLGDAQDRGSRAQFLRPRRRQASSSSSGPESSRVHRGRRRAATTRAPSSASRASVPPHASDSSSGCANTARTVRPERHRSLSLPWPRELARGSGDRPLRIRRPSDRRRTARPTRSWTRRRSSANTRSSPATMSSRSRKHDAGHVVVHDLAHRAAVERRHRRAARHRFGQHEAERFARLNRIEQRARAAVELHLVVEVRLRRSRRCACRPRAARLSRGSRPRRRPPGSAGCRRAWRPRSPAARPCPR